MQVYLRQFPEIAARADLVRLLVEGDRTGRRESTRLAEDLLEGFRESIPPTRPTQVIVRPRDENLTLADDDASGLMPVSTGPFDEAGRRRRAPRTRPGRRSKTGSNSTWIRSATSRQGESNCSLPTAQRSRFTLLRRLGAGGMGVVFEAYDEARGELVALKTMRRVDPAALVRFKQEFRSLSDISHPNLVNLYQLFSVQDRWYFTMELIDGRDFLTYVRCGPESLERIPFRSRPPGCQHCGPDFDEGRLREGLAQLAEGIHALHARGQAASRHQADERAGHAGRAASSCSTSA